MNRIDRLTAILIMLQAKRVVTAGAIAARYGISLRTVYRDIRALEDAGIPIGAQAGKGYFLAEGFHLPPVMFTPNEAGALLLGAKLVEKFSDMRVNQHFAGALDKIKAVLGDADKDSLNRLDNLMTVLLAAPSANEKISNNWLSDIQSVLAQSRVIRIEYNSNYKDELTTRSVEPLGLCFYAGRWHLLAYCQLRRDYRDFRVDRIKAVAVTGEYFDRQRHGDLDKLVKHIVLSADLKSATVRFTPQAARLISDQKYYYGFVRQWEQDEAVEMEFLVPDYGFLGHWLLSFVDRVTVLAPEVLKQAMADHVRRLGMHYRIWADEKI
jgi:predicted DNA-binding transcriptional regulator YafY